MVFVATCRASEENRLRGVIDENAKGLAEYSIKFSREQRREETLVCIFETQNRKELMSIAAKVEKLAAGPVVTF